MVPPTKREKAAAGNGDMLLWHEYEADVARAGENAVPGRGPSKYPMAHMLDPNYKTYLAIEELRRWFDDQKRTD